MGRLDDQGDIDQRVSVATTMTAEIQAKLGEGRKAQEFQTENDEKIDTLGLGTEAYYQWLYGQYMRHVFGLKNIDGGMHRAHTGNTPRKGSHRSQN